MIVMPTTPTLPPEINIPDGASTVEFRAHTLGSTCLAGHAGLPQISIPAGVAAGCPVGLSFVGWAGGDEALLDLGGQARAAAESPLPLTPMNNAPAGCSLLDRRMREE